MSITRHDRRLKTVTSK